MPLSFVFILINIVAVNVCSRIAASSKFFLFQPVIFTLCAFNSPPQPTAGGKRRENGGLREWQCGLESLSGIMKLQRTIPKPQQLEKPAFAFLPWGRLILIKYEMLGFHCKGN